MRTTTYGQSSLLLLDIIEFLNKRGIPYAIIGAFAASFYGVVRASLDADAVISILSPAVTDDFCANLNSWGLNAVYRKGDTEDPIAGVINIEDQFSNRVDLLMGIRGMRQEVFSRCQEAQFMGVSIKLVSIEDFIALKIFAGSPKDVGDVMGVMDVSGDKINSHVLQEITSQYGADCLQKLQRILKR
jgi:predicted nucleotidyltransferase